MRTHVGPYRVVRELGRGGMGLVLEVAREGDPRRLALKLMLVGADAGEAVTRFRREAELMARVNHPGVVAVHAFDVTPEGPYLVTDLVEGQGLDATLRARFLTPEQAARLAHALADALAALHGKGVVHRDLKPANVIVRPDGAPVLLDFGIARDLDTKERLTRTGALLGTPEYMAPEQAAGESPSRMGPPTDVYGLGAILYEALTCRPPFMGSDPMNTLKKVLFDQPAWPAAVRPDVPAALDAIVRKAMAKPPERRYATAAALRDDLARFLAGEEPLALAEAPREPRSRAPLIALAGVVLALGGLGLGLALARREDPAPPPPPPKTRRPPPPTGPKKLLEAPSANAKAMREPLLSLPHDGGSRVQARFLGDREAVAWSEQGHVHVWRFETTERERLATASIDLTPLQDADPRGYRAAILPAAAVVDRTLFLRCAGRILRARLPDLQPAGPPREAVDDGIGPLAVVRRGGVASLVVPTARGVRLLDPATLAEREWLAYAPAVAGYPGGVGATDDGAIVVGGGDAWTEDATATFGWLRAFPAAGPPSGFDRLPTLVIGARLRPGGAGAQVGVATYSGYVFFGAPDDPARLQGGPEDSTGPDRVPHTKAVAFSPDGRWMATVHSFQTWDLDPRQPDNATVTPDAMRARHQTHALKVWDLASERPRPRTLRLLDPPASVDWSPDGALLLIGFELLGKVEAPTQGAQVWRFDPAALPAAR